MDCASCVRSGREGAHGKMHLRCRWREALSHLLLECSTLFLLRPFSSRNVCYQSSRNDLRCCRLTMPTLLLNVRGVAYPLSSPAALRPVPSVLACHLFCRSWREIRSFPSCAMFANGHVGELRPAVFFPKVEGRCRKICNDRAALIVSHLRATVVVKIDGGRVTLEGKSFPLSQCRQARRVISSFSSTARCCSSLWAVARMCFSRRLQ